MEEKLKEMCAEILYLDASDIDLDTPFKTMDLDSLDFVDLILWVEDDFDVDIPDEDVENFKCLRDVLNYLQNYENV
jgi:acyl carrier protein